MQNCLIETLNGSVDYKEFPKIGHLKVKVTETTSPSETNSYIRVAYDGVAANAEILGDGYFMRTFGGDSKGTTQTASLYGDNYEMRDVYVSKGAFDIEYSDKYKMKFIGTGSNGKRFNINIEDLAHCTNLQYIEFISGNVEGDIACLAKLSNLKNVLLSYGTGKKVYGNTSVFKHNSFPNLAKVSFESSVVEGDISDFSACTNLNRLDTQFSNIKGNIASIGNLTKITQMNLSEFTEGTIESFVRAQRASGRTTCTGINSQYLYYCTKLSFNGKPLLETVGTETMSKISWTETTITVKSTTITA